MNFAPFCCDGLSLLEQGLHALSLGVRLPLGSHLLLQLFATARLLLSFGFRCCLWWDWYSQLRIFEDVRCLDQKMIAWPSFIMGADIVGLNGDFGLNPVLLPVKKLYLCVLYVCLFFVLISCTDLGLQICHRPCAVPSAATFHPPWAQLTDSFCHQQWHRSPTTQEC